MTIKARTPKTSRSRLDVLVASSAGISRERARALILAGHVKVDGVRQSKAGLSVSTTSKLDIEEQDAYVGRGGRKLEHALREFEWSPNGLLCLDVGASTGGFTDCLLAHGAASVVALDVGYGHLAWKLRQNVRVRVIERTNFRYADLAAIGAPFDFVVADVSFISLTTLAVQFGAALQKGGRIIVLVKPQFEAGRDAVQRGGIVQDAATQVKAIERVIESFARMGLASSKLTFSPIRGRAGNIEFLLGAHRDEARAKELDVAGVVRRAHEALK